MINKWILNNFKSIGEETPLDFRKLTMFTGANSSGKSTILQSILLVTQTLQVQNPSKSIILNGWFKKFGSYSDIVTGRDIDKNIKIGFSITDSDEERDIWIRRRSRLRNIPMPPMMHNQETRCEFVLSSAGQKENLQPEIETARMETYIGDMQFECTEVSKWIERSEVEDKVYTAIKEKFSATDLNYTIKGMPTRYRSVYGDELPWKPIGVRMNHFMPDMMIGYCTLIEQAKIHLRQYLLMGSSYYYEVEEIEKKITPLVQDKTMDIVEQLKEKGFLVSDVNRKKYEGLKKKFTLKKFQSLLRTCPLGDDDKQKYITQIVEKLNGLPEEYRIEMLPVYRTESIETTREFFRNRINYLGPLREEPKSLYPLSNDGSTTEVGLKGENTAAVYHNNQNNIVDYIAPSAFKDLSDIKLNVKSGRLSEAVNLWLNYMGVASNVVTDDKGKIGHSLQVSNDLNIKQDLTHVGVGVSQVLPILVMALLARKGDVIILEQPELHLHPKVQTRLADFFVAMNAIGKQCIIETHSEYMINRLRYLVAISKDSTVADDTMIYFVEKEAGHSKYRPVTINKYGVIEDWPEGFFDESERIAAEILRAGMEKKAQEEGDDYEE